MKKILSLLTCCVFLVACQTTPQASPEQISIEEVYKVDAKVLSNSKTASEVVTKLESTRLKGCPQAFVTAYKRNIKAWTNMVDLEKKMYGVNMQKATSDMERFISNYSNNATQAAIDLKKAWPSFAKEIDAATEEISRTKNAYIIVGAKYDAVYRDSSLF